MIGMLPKRLFKNSQEARRILQNSLEQCDRWPRFKRCFRSVLSDILTRKEEPGYYPFNFKIFQDLYKGNCDHWEKILKEMEDNLSPKFIEKALSELKAEPSDHFAKKLSSLEAEAICALKLKRLSDTFDVIRIDPRGNSPGDLLLRTRKGDWVIEVEDKFEEDFSLKCIEDALVGAMYLEDSQVLRDYSSVSMAGEGINDSFRKNILKFIHAELTPILNFIKDMSKHNYESWQSKATKFFYKRDQLIGSLKMHAEWYKDPEILGIKLSFDKQQDRKAHPDKGQLELRLEPRNGESYSISYNSFWWGDPKPDLVKLNLRIVEKVERIKEQLSTIKSNGKAGFILLNLHPKYEPGVEKYREEVLKALKNGIDESRIPIVIYGRFTPSFQHSHFYIVSRAASGTPLEQLKTKSEQSGGEE